MIPEHSMSNPLSPRQYDLDDSDPSVAPTIKLVNLILVEGLINNAGAIRVSPTDPCTIHYLVEGEWRQVMKVPAVVGQAVWNRLRLMADLEPTTARRPHRGEIHAIFKGRNLVLTTELTTDLSDLQEITIHCPQPGTAA
jgi:type II secretory ATPase GspE/PulE/Tfp pilus assembly ATPase PilB-like protein